MATTVTSDFTYNLTTLTGAVRLWTQDTDPLQPINSDSEINAAIVASGYNGNSSDAWQTLNIMPTVYIASAIALEFVMVSAAKLALIEKIGALSDNTKVTYDAVKDAAATLRLRAMEGYVPNPQLYPDGFCLDFVPFSLPIHWADGTQGPNGVTIPGSTLDRW